MKIIFSLLLLTLSVTLYAQDPAAYLKIFDQKVYSLKNKGVQDFVVDIESSKLTKQMNEQQLFGKVEELVFRVYWTANPERLAIEVIGLPDGFKEVKEELKAGISPLLENLIPPTSAQKFAGYKFSQGKMQREILALDTSGIAPIPSFSIKFDEQDKIISITGNKPVGTLKISPVYEKEAFADGKWVLTSQKTESSENGQTMIIQKHLTYGKSQGVSVVTEVNATTQYQSSAADSKAVKFNENVEFKNYKINEGIALKYFLGESKPDASKTKP